jgi:hypothetical protein
VKFKREFKLHPPRQCFVFLVVVVCVTLFPFTTTSGGLFEWLCFGFWVWFGLCVGCVCFTFSRAETMRFSFVF